LHEKPNQDAILHQQHVDNSQNIQHTHFDTAHIGIQLPEKFNNLLDVNTPSNNYLPFFWHIPRTDGATINDILGVCYHLRVASNAGSVQGHGQDEILQLLDGGAGHSDVNVDVSSSQGIVRAAALGLVPSRLSDVVVSPLINESGQLYDQTNQGKIFTMIRHPVERGTSLFHFLQDIHWRAPETFDHILANINIDDFFRQRMGESNWQVRYLTNQVTKPFM
jgi:hypothetical protein